MALWRWADRRQTPIADQAARTRSKLPQCKELTGIIAEIREQVLHVARFQECTQTLTARKRLLCGFIIYSVILS